jgi:anti-sigma B factor antagonist
VDVARGAGRPDPDEHGPLRPGPPSRLARVDVVLSGSHPGAAVLGVSGEVDLATAPALESAVARVFDRPEPRVVLDLTEVTFLASRGLAVLLDAHQRAADRDVHLAVVVVHSPVRRVLEISGLTSVLRCHATVAEALAAT